MAVKVWRHSPDELSGAVSDCTKRTNGLGRTHALETDGYTSARDRGIHSYGVYGAFRPESRPRRSAGCCRRTALKLLELQELSTARETATPTSCRRWHREFGFRWMPPRLSR